MGATKRLCELCCAPSKNVCSGCKEVAYCSSDHQVKMWRWHRYLCGFSHLQFIRQPSFEINEARAILCTLGDKYSDRDENASQAQVEEWLKQDTEVVQNFNKSIDEEFKDDEFGRNKKISYIRSVAWDEMSHTQKILLCRMNALGAFYGAAGIETNLASSHSSYHYPYVSQRFHFQCLSTVSLDCMRGKINPVELKGVHSNMLNSLERLEKMTIELERRGMDAGGDYKGNTGMLQMHRPMLDQLLTVATQRATKNAN